MGQGINVVSCSSLSHITDKAGALILGYLGATYVEKEFLTWLEKWLEPAAYRKIPQQKLGYGSRLLNSFETLKTHFSGIEDDIEINIPGECGIDDDESKNISDRVLTITKFVGIGFRIRVH